MGLDEAAVGSSQAVSCLCFASTRPAPACQKTRKLSLRAVGWCLSGSSAGTWLVAPGHRVAATSYGAWVASKGWALLWRGSVGALPWHVVQGIPLVVG